LDEARGARLASGRGVRAGSQAGELRARFLGESLSAPIERPRQHGIDALGLVDGEAVLARVGREIVRRGRARPEERLHRGVVFGVRQATDTGWPRGELVAVDDDAGAAPRDRKSVV